MLKIDPPSPTLSSKAYITTASSSNPNAKVILINDTRNSPVNKIDGDEWYLQCYSNNEAVTFWGLKIELQSNSFGFKKNGNTTIEITINDITRNDQLDIFSAFSVNDKYFANLNNADGEVNIFSDIGQFIYPVCSTKLARNDNLENVFSNINSNVNSWSGWQHEYPISLTTSGNLNDWYRISTETETDESSFTYKVTNDGINNQSHFEFTSGNVNYRCDYNDSFNFDSDIYFYLQNDCRFGNNERSWIRSINITSRTILVPTTEPSISPTTDPTRDPTSEPTQEPTIDPSKDLTKDPTFDPTQEPATDPAVEPTTASILRTKAPTLKPTTENTPTFNVSYSWLISDDISLSDPFGRFEAQIQTLINDEDGESGISETCKSCFIWEYKQLSSEKWNNISFEHSDDIVVTTQPINTNGLYIVSLTMQSIRGESAGNCVNDYASTAHPFQPDKAYALRLRVTTPKTNSEFSDYVSTSPTVQIYTNSLPVNGYCNIPNVDNLLPLGSFYLNCNDWYSPSELEYNALVDNVLIGTQGFVNNASLLSGIASTGNVTITVLIKDVLYTKAITCFELDAKFPEIIDLIQDNETNVSISDIFDQVSTATNSNTSSLGNNLDIAVAVGVIVNDLYDNNLTNSKEAAKIINDIVENIIQTSKPLNYILGINTTNVSLTSDDIINEIATIKSITNNKEIIGIDTTITLTNKYIPGILESIDTFLAERNTETNTTTSNTSLNSQSVIQEELFSIVTQLQDLISNLEQTLSNETDTNTNNNLTESLIEYSLLSQVKALSASNPGETYNYIISTNNETKIISSTKYSTNVNIIDDKNVDDNDNAKLPSCGHGNERLTLPKSFIDKFDGVFDCAFVSSTQNNFMPNVDRTSQTIVSTNIYDGDSHDIIKFNTDRCYPYSIAISMDKAFIFNVSQISTFSETYQYHSCDYWNVTNSLWDTSGCWLNDIVNDTVICACTHLTSFSVSKDEFIPQSNIITDLHSPRDLTIDNIIKYPTVTITVLSTFFLFVVICIINPRSSKTSTKSILAYQDIKYKSFQEETAHQDIAGKELKYIDRHMPNKDKLGFGIKRMTKGDGATKELCKLQLALFIIYLRNDHSFLSLFARTSGTNFSVKQRMGCFFMYLCTIMVATGIFYGIDQTTIMRDIAASFLISFSGTLPVVVIRKIFEKSRPREEPSKVDSIQRELETGGEDAIQRLDTAQHNIPDLAKQATRMVTFSSKISDIHQNNRQHKIDVIEEIRKTLLKEMHPLPHICKKVAWIIIILWSAAASFIAIVYGLDFDLKYDASPNQDNLNVIEGKYDEECWNNTMNLRIEDELSQQMFNEQQLEIEEQNASTYGGSDSGSWLLSVGQSLLASLLLWQPITVYLLTWLKLWMFTWNLRMKIGPKNICKLCKRCCCGYDSHTLNKLEKRISTALGLGEKPNKGRHRVRTESSIRSRRTESWSSNMSHNNRPLDLLSILGHPDFVIDDTQLLQLSNNSDIVNTPTSVLESDAILTENLRDDSDNIDQDTINKEEIELMEVDENKVVDEANGDNEYEYEYYYEDEDVAVQQQEQGDDEEYEYYDEVIEEATLKELDNMMNDNQGFEYQKSSAL